MQPKSALVHLFGVLLAVVICVTSRSGGEAAAPKPLTPAKAAPEQFTPSGKEAVASGLERLRRTGVFNHPDCPWVVRARRVRGDTLYFVEFLHRREDGKGFDRVGKAVQATLTFSEEYNPWTFPWDGPAPPVRCDTLRARVGQMEMLTEGGTRFRVQNRVLDLALPARLRESGFRPFAEAEAHLSQDQREALGKGYFLRPEQKMLLAAFGEECGELLGVRHIARSETGQTVLACDDAVKLDSGRRCKFATLAVARFDRTGEVLLRFWGTDITAETSEVCRLLSGDDSESLTLTGSGGLRLTLPGAKATR